MRWSTLITCEHARGGLPEGLDLGLPEAVLASHVSCDRGSREIATRLAAALGAPLHLGSFSRLVVDLNRMEDNPAVILAETYGVRVPGNEGLTDEAREARIARWHRPYRDAARADAERLAEAGGCLHLSIHSFDRAVDPPRRQFDAGVLFDTEREPEATMAAALAAALAARGVDTRLNEPYAGVPEGLTSWLRGQIAEERYVGIEIEACQAWMTSVERLHAFADHLAHASRVVARSA